MLSAIAARKAAQAAKQSKSQNDASEASNMTWKELSTPISTSELEESLSASDSEAAAIPRKRKAKRHAPRKMDQKRAKMLTTKIGRTRYFEAEEVLEEGFDDGNIPSHYSQPYSSSPNEPPLNPTRPDSLISGLVIEDRRSGRYSPSGPILDSSEEDGEEKQYSPEKTGFTSSVTTPHQLFSPRLDATCFRLTTDDLRNMGVSLNVDNGTLILLPTGRSVTFVGTAYITLLQGAITVLGTPLRPSLYSHRVFSPRCSPLATIENLDIGGVMSEPTNLSSSIWGRLPRRILNAVNDSDSVLVIQPLASGVEDLGKVCGIFDGVFDVGLDVRDTEVEDAIGIEGFHPVNPHSRRDPQLQPFLMPESWNKALNSAVPCSDDLEPHSFVALIKGSKNFGKSTFARTLLNRLTTRYRRVAFLECDLGQSEFTPGGMVALHLISRPVLGPPFTHPIIPHRAHYIGHLTPRSSPSHYLACIQALVRTYRMDIQYTYLETRSDVTPEEDSLKELDNRLQTFVPLVVNTQGWIKGLGGDLLRKIEEIVQATDIFDLDAQSATYPPHRSQRIHSSDTRLHSLQPILSSPLMSYYTPSDYRSLSILSYFHALFSAQKKEARSWSTDLPLCARAPWEMDCKEVTQRFVLVGAGFEDVVPDELVYALNCGIVALVCDEDHVSESPVAESESREFSWPFLQGAPVPSPTTSHCLGLALIRGVNAATHTLHLLTPISLTDLTKCRVFVKGELELPVWGMLDFREGQTEGVAGVKWDKVPYLQMGSRERYVIGGARRRVRRNLMRRGQLQQ